MKYYYVKVDLFGIPAGRVERFTDQRAGHYVLDGSIEHFDPKNPKHAAALKAQEKEAEDRRANETRKLEAEGRRRAAAAAVRP